MVILDELRGRATILRLADLKGVPPAHIEAAIQQTIDAAWSGHDRDSRGVQRMIFRGKKPTPALFVGRLARYAGK